MEASALLGVSPRFWESQDLKRSPAPLVVLRQKPCSHHGPLTQDESIGKL